MVEKFWDAVAAFCSKHDIAYRAITETCVFVGAALTGWFLGSTEIDSAWAIPPAVVAALAIWVREGAGHYHALGRTQSAKRKVVAKLLELASIAMVPAEAHSDEEGGKFIRANLMRHDPQQGTLKIWARYNMEEDADRGIEIQEHSGLSGHVFMNCTSPQLWNRERNGGDPRSEVRPVAVNRAVREEMRGMLCVPVFDPYEEGLPVGQRKKLGVLCFDSDLPVEEIGFELAAVENMAVRAADLVAIALTS